jgi:hypothetical protein
VPFSRSAIFDGPTLGSGAPGGRALLQVSSRGRPPLSSIALSVPPTGATLSKWAKQQFVAFAVPRNGVDVVAPKVAAGNVAPRVSREGFPLAVLGAAPAPPLAKCYLPPCGPCLRWHVARARHALQHVLAQRPHRSGAAATDKQQRSKKHPADEPRRRDVLHRRKRSVRTQLPREL